MIYEELYQEYLNEELYQEYLYEELYQEYLKKHFFKLFISNQFRWRIYLFKILYPLQMRRGKSFNIAKRGERRKNKKIN